MIDTTNNTQVEETNNTQVEEYQQVDEEETEFRDGYERSRKYSNEWNRENGFKEQEKKDRNDQIWKDEEDVLSEYDSFCANLKYDIIHCLDVLIQQGRDDLAYIHFSDCEEDDLPAWKIKYDKFRYIEGFMEIMEEEYLKRLKKAKCTNWPEQYCEYLEKFKHDLF